MIIPQILRRTFEAAQHPKGSPERDRLNLSAVTSEYYPSKPYAVHMGGKNGHHTFRTKTEAKAWTEANS